MGFWKIAYSSSETSKTPRLGLANRSSVKRAEMMHGRQHTRDEEEGTFRLLTLDGLAVGEVVRGRAVCSLAHFVKGPAIFRADEEAWLCAKARTGAVVFSKMLEFIFRCRDSFDSSIIFPRQWQTDERESLRRCYGGSSRRFPADGGP